MTRRRVDIWQEMIDGARSVTVLSNDIQLEDRHASARIISLDGGLMCFYE